MSDPAESLTNPVRGPSRLLIIVLCASGALTVLAGIALGVAVEPALFAICLIGVVDFALAWLFTSGRLGPEAQRRREAAAEGEAAADPSYNPYARED